jgi:hypothetical protein
MGWECSMYGRDEKLNRGLIGKLEGRRPLVGGLSIDGRVILKWVLRK